MPSVLTHYGFNREVMESGFSFLKNNEDIYLVGAQGPDPFLFRGIVPSFNNKNSNIIRKYGSRLHKEDPRDVFSLFFEYANESENKDILYSYILGAGLHYILDRKVHPYVYYKTGFSNDKKMKAKYFVDHTLFETHMDVLLMNNRYRDYKVKPSLAIKCDKDKIQKVSEMYGKLAKHLIKEDKVDGRSFQEAYEDMLKIEKILYSKKGIKKRLVNTLFKGTPLNTMMHPNIVKDDIRIDYLNLGHNEWKNPASEIIYNKSVNDLLDEAKVEANEWRKIVVEAYDGRINKEKLKKFSDGMIYDGYKKDMKMKVFENVFGRKEKKK